MYTIQDFLETKGAWGPSFDAKSERMVYLSNLTGVAQAYLYHLNTKESVQLTHGDEPIEFALFSPTEDLILIGYSKGGNERTQIAKLDPHNQELEWLVQNEEAMHKFGGWAEDGKSFAYKSNVRNGKDFDVYLFDMEKRVSRLVFDRGGWCNANGISPDNRWMAVKIAHTFTENQLVLVNLENGETRDLTPALGQKEYGYCWWTSDGKGFYFRNNTDRNLFSLDYYDLDSGKISGFSNGIDGLPKDLELEHVRMTKDKSRMLLRFNRDGYGDVFFVDLKDKKAQHVAFPEGETDDFEWSDDARCIAFDFQSPTENVDIWVFDVETAKAERVTQSPRRVPSKACSAARVIRYPTFDGKQIPALLYLPNKRLSDKMPVIVNVHGGPEGQSGPSFLPLMQFFLDQGWAVVLPNIRGSSGYGKEYLSADDKGRRWDAIKDIEWLNSYLRSREDMDPEKIVIMGGSYGGYMTLAALAFQPELWAAGVDIVGMSNLVSFLENTSIWRRALREAEYGTLEHDRELLQKLSPLGSVDKIKAPLFVIHGANDPRVPLSEAEQIVKTVKEKGGIAELLVYPDEGHGLAKLKNRLDAYPKVADFLAKHVIAKA